MVAPNSPSARAQHSTAPATRDGRTSGRVTLQSTVHRLAPSVRAASSNRVSMERSPASTVITRNGIATNVSAMMAPAVVKGRWTPKVVASHPPTRPRRPKASSSATPPTTGGSTIGNTVRARNTDRPGKVSRAKVQASGTPRVIAIAVAENDASNDKRKAASTSAEPNCCQADAQGVRSSKPSSGMMKNAAPALARMTIGRGAEGRSLRRLRVGKAIAGKGLPATGVDVTDERPGQRPVLRILEDDNWILRHHVERWCNGDALNRLAGGLHVREVNDAGVRLADRHLAQDGLHIRLLARGLDAHPGFLQRLGRVVPARNRRRAEHDHQPRASQVGKRGDMFRVPLPYHDLEIVTSEHNR